MMTQIQVDEWWAMVRRIQLAQVSWRVVVEVTGR